MSDYRLSLTVEYPAEAALAVEEDGETALALGEPYVDGHASEYEGPYVVRHAPFLAQTLATEGLLMANDVTVEEIPFFKTTNPSGGYTAIIGE